MNNETQVLDAIESVFNISEDCKLKPVTFELLEGDLSFLSNQFTCSNIEAFFLANIFCLNIEDEWISINELKNHFDCKIIDIVKFNKDLFTLFDSSLLEVEDYNNLISLINTGVKFKCNRAVTSKVIDLKSSILERNIKNENQYSFIEEMHKLLDNNSQNSRRKGIVENYTDILGKVDKVCVKYKEHPVSCFFIKNGFDSESKLMFAFILWNKLNGNRGGCASTICDLIYGENAMSVEKLQELLCEKHFLLQKKYVEFKKAKFGGKSIIITNKAEKELREHSFEYYQESKNENLHIIKTKDIHRQNLFYNEKSAIQIEQILNVLKVETLNKIQSNLSSKGLPKGITTIFYGPPGTGKTETVLQLAKQSNRLIMKVDISETKSMWYGESQKLVKGIFDDYRDLCKECDELPILFFNEADAVFATRGTSNNGAIERTENEIQNIILEELEVFEGILMATTNLEGNLDPAFERRLLYKIELAKPSLEIKAKIWQIKIEKLSEGEVDVLAENFDFSGGQINNVVRKIEMYEILNDSAIDFNEILIYCEEESFTKEKVRVGFKK